MNTKKLVLLLALAGLSSTQAGFVECFNKHRESITWIPELQTDQLLSNNRFFSMTVDNNIIVTAPLTKMLTTFFTAKENSVKTVASHTFHSFVKTFVSLALLYLAETSEHQMRSYSSEDLITTTLKGKKVILSYLIPVALRIFATLNYIAGQTNTSYAELFKAIRKLSLKDFADDKSLANILRQSVNVLLPLCFSLEGNLGEEGQSIKDKFDFYNNFSEAFSSRQDADSSYNLARNLVLRLQQTESTKDNEAIESLKKLFGISAEVTPDTRRPFRAAADAFRLRCDDASFHNVRTFIQNRINDDNFFQQDQTNRQGWNALAALFNLRRWSSRSYSTPASFSMPPLTTYTPEQPYSSEQ